MYTPFSQNGATPLMAAAQEGHLSVVELLVSVRAQVNSQNKVSNWCTSCIRVRALKNKLCRSHRFEADTFSSHCLFLHVQTIFMLY